ncbi:MAG: hypothetical protein AVDCRST_MAG79-1617 [uncultured Thermoleophilia bacterium]|uniref:Uncharacterized protein n=1 Tax=uncultured Thermoleophilia bacterium TaxID=1497501 RepID=A0A6J4U1N4_9ACTN|nr:MAG: hypothetical protein AVDCRST_MAG79-1617 [uncultured Thermoleophilia bacterium]
MSSAGCNFNVGTTERGRVRVIDPRSWAAAVPLVVVGALAAGLAAAFARDEVDVATVVALGLCAAVAELQGARLSGRLVASAGSALCILAALTVGPLGAAIVGLCAMLGDARKPYLRWFSYVGVYVTSGVAAGFAALSVGPLDASRDLGDYAAQAVLAAVAAFAANFVGNSFVAVVRGVRPLRQHLTMVLLVAGSGVFFPVPLIIVLAYGYDEASLVVLLFSLIPLLAANALLRLYRDKTALAQQFAQNNMALALALIRALDARDAYTAGHSAAVAVYARDLAEAAGLPPADVSKVQLAALLHDVGKIGVTTETLNKPGRLDDREWEEIRRHPIVGERIAGEAAMFGDVPTIIRHHHERLDGRGYPDALSGAEIPEASAIIGLADAYNAMTQSRSYRGALTPEAAIAELRRCAGTQFRPQLVELFVHILERRDEQYRLGSGSRFSLDGQRAAIVAELGDRRALLDIAPAA